MLSGVQRKSPKRNGKKVFADAKTQKSSVVLGNPSENRPSQWTAATASQYPNPGKPTYKLVQKYGNHSDVNVGDNKYREFNSGQRAEFCKETSAQSTQYQRRKPAPGFDRLTASKTNYDLGTDAERKNPDLYTSGNMRATQNPKTLPVPGGPTFPSLAERDYNPHNLAGYKFELITGKAENYIPRPQPGSLPNCDKDLYGNLVGYGNPDTYYDLTVGRTRPKPKVPVTMEEAEKNVRAPLDSLMCLRPPLESDARHDPLGNSRKEGRQQADAMRRRMGASSITF